MPEGGYIKDPGVYDMVISQCEEKENKSYLPVYAFTFKNCEGLKYTAEYCIDEAKRQLWIIKSIAVKCGIPEKQFTDLSPSAFIGKTLRIEPKKEMYNDKDYLKLNPFNIGVSQYEAKDFETEGEDVPF